MENSITEAKKELIQWIKEMDDFEQISELLEIKNSEIRADKIAETQSEYAIKDDFDERFARGLNSEDSRKRTREFISKLSWEK